MDKEELKEFAIGDEKLPETTEVSSSTDELDNFDFSDDKGFDIDKYHELINFLKKSEATDEMKEKIKLEEAKNIISSTAKEFLGEEFVNQYSKEEDNLINLIKKFDPNLDEVKKMTEEQKDKIYDIAQYLFNNFQKKLNQLNFHFPVDNEERKFIFNVFKNKIEYDQNEVFQLDELKNNYLDIDFKNENGVYNTYINVNDLIVFYHLFSKYKVKGITNEFYNFIQILKKIGERIKLFNAYNVVIQRLSNDFQLWGGNLSFEENITGKVIEPVKGEQILNDVNSSEPLILKS
jgi:hypothetical protein